MRAANLLTHFLVDCHRRLVRLGDILSHEEEEHRRVGAQLLAGGMADDRESHRLHRAGLQQRTLLVVLEGCGSTIT